MRSYFTPKGLFAALLTIGVLFFVTFCCVPFRTWGIPEPLDDCANNAMEGQLAMNAESQAFALWRTHDTPDANSTSRDRVWVNRYDGIAWDQAMPISDKVWRIKDPQIAMNDNGHAVAVWYQIKIIDSENFPVILGRYFNGSAWGDPMQIINLEPLEPGESYGPAQVGIDAAGSATAVWLNSGNVWASRFDGISWGSAVLVNDGSGTVLQKGELHFATNAAGNTIAVWEQNTEDGCYIWANRFDGTAWGTAEPISVVPTGNAPNPTQIAMNDNGHAIAVWEQTAESGYTIWANGFDGKAWGTAMVIEQMPGPSRTIKMAFQIEMSAAGKAVVVWDNCYRSNFPMSYHNIWAKYFDGTAWTAAERISIGDETGNAARPQIAMDAAGNAMVVWTQSLWVGDNMDEYTPFNIYVRQFDGVAWGAARTVDRSSNDAGPAFIGMDADGNAIAIWGQLNDEGIGCVWASRYE